MLRPALFCCITLLLAAGCKTPSILVTEEQRLGDQYNNQHDYEQAIVHYKNSLDASAKLGVYRNLDMEADVCRKISHAYQVQGNYDEAISYTSLAFTKDSVQGNTLAMIEDVRDLGEIHLYIGDFSRGMGYLKQALAMNDGMDASLKGQNRLSVADTYLSLGQANNVLGRFSKSREYCEAALDIYQAENDALGKMEALLLLGNINVNAGLYGPAINMIEESSRLAEREGLNTARQLETRAEIHTAMGELEKSLNNNLTALDQSRKTNIVPQIIWTSMRVGDSYRDIGDIEEAMSYYESALEMQDTANLEALALRASADRRLGNVEQARQYYLSVGADVGGGLATLKLADLQAESGREEEAISNYTEAAAMFGRSGVDEGQAQAYLGMATINIASGLQEAARVALDQAAEYAEYPENRWRLWYLEGKLSELEGDPGSAIEHYQESIKIIEEIRGNFIIDEFKSTYIEEKIKVYDRLIKLLLERGKQDVAISFAERARARAFLDQVGNKKIDVGDVEGKELIQTEQELRMQIQNLTRMVQQNELEGQRGMSSKEIHAELTRSQADYTRLLQRIKLENEAYHCLVNVDPLEPGGTTGQLDDETALLYYWIGEDHGTAWIFSNQGIRSVPLEINAAETKQMVDLCRQVVRRTAEFRGTEDWESKVSLQVPRREPVSAKEQFMEAYKKLIAPAYPLLKDFRNIGIIPHGSLHFLPFQALIAADGSFLVEHHNLFYTPSTSIYQMCLKKENTAGKKFLGMALGELELGMFSGLPGTTWELEQISPHFPGEKFTYEESSTETLFKEMAGDYEYVHLATHGMMNPMQPVFSYMLMNPSAEDDGQLTVNEVFGLNLQSRLVTLSACQTGLGDLSKGDEVTGLSRAFLYAGSQSVIVSLWSVADQPTAELMAAFYNYLDNNPSYVALSNAQRDVMKKYRAPFYWAPFQLIGTGR